ncbi:Chorismate mutase [Abortiporus biennis]
MFVPTADTTDSVDSTATTADTASVDSIIANRPTLTVPSLVQIRDILAQLEAPIISALTERLQLATDSSLYSNNGAKLKAFLGAIELADGALGRYAYGKLEYPYVATALAPSPDKTSKSVTFPAGRFHQDSFTGNSNLTAFYLQTLVPLFNSTTAYYYHLDNSTVDPAAIFHADATLLQLLSHRAHIGKIVAETKFAGNVTGYTPLIQAGDDTSIRVLLTNTTQEAGVLAQASTAATSFSNAWVGSGALVSTQFASNLQNAAAKVFRELIDITTEIEIQYLLARFN